MRCLALWPLRRQAQYRTDDLREELEKPVQPGSDLSVPWPQTQQVAVLNQQAIRLVFDGAHIRTYTEISSGDARPIAVNYGHIVLPFQRQGHIPSCKHSVFAKE
jgi:hypothetical protein